MPSLTGYTTARSTWFPPQDMRRVSDRYVDEGFRSIPSHSLASFQGHECRYETNAFANARPVMPAHIRNAPDQHPYATKTLRPTYMSERHRVAAVNITKLPQVGVLEPSTSESHQQYHEMPMKHSRQGSTLKEQRVGGVAAHLDYEMDEMVDFVSAMTQGMYDIFASGICLADIDMARSVLNSNSLPSQDFRKFTSQVLTSTRLPSSTILLGMLYLSKRMVTVSKKRTWGDSAREMRSLLIVALVLGSKFLDDNTFQNRSWSEVSNIPVQEINRLEFYWLADIKWDLHIDQEDPDGLKAWLDHWTYFQARKLDYYLANTLKQTSLDHAPTLNQQMDYGHPQYTQGPLSQASVGRSALNSNRSMALSGPYQKQHGEHSRHPQYDYSPPSAPESGPVTPTSIESFRMYCGSQPAFQRSLKLPSPSHFLSASGLPSRMIASHPPTFDYLGQETHFDEFISNAQYPRAHMACA